MSGERVYRGAVRLFSVVMIGLGLAILAITAANGGGTVGFLMGIAFLAVGAGRLWVSARMER
jgi:hypothetical protein